MTIRQREMGRYKAPDDIYQQLAQADPAQRATLVLRLVEDHPQGRLELPACAGQQAILHHLDLSPAALAQRRDAALASPPWWSAAEQRANLQGALLSGAQLRQANLQHVDLTGADLQGANLGAANLRGAILEGANLSGADLAGADLSNALLGGARLADALLEDAVLSGAVLRYAHLQNTILEGANLQGADLWGANLAEASLEEADLQGAILRDTQLPGADLSDANLQHTMLRAANLQQAKLYGVNLQGAILGETNLRGADLRNARLQDLALTTCDITHVLLSGARLNETQFQMEQLGGAIGEELAADYRRATQAYLALERNFRDLGDPDAASWSYRQRRRMQKLEAWQLARAARDRHEWATALSYYAQYTGDAFVEWLCDYGDSVPRVLRALLTVYLLFAVIYFITGSVARIVETPFGQLLRPTRNLLDVALFTLISMASPEGPTVNLQQRHEFVHILTGIQTLICVALTGLLGFVLGNRIRR